METFNCFMRYLSFGRSCLFMISIHCVLITCAIDINGSSGKANEDVGLNLASTSNATTSVSTTVSLSTTTYATTTLTSTHQPDECELEGACNSTSEFFLPLGVCEHCYCQCSPYLNSTYQWTKQCCPENQVWNPNAYPNPNSCDTKDQYNKYNIPECPSSNSKSIHKFKFGVQLYYFLLFIMTLHFNTLQLL